jgi:hypothetical protein
MIQIKITLLGSNNFGRRKVDKVFRRDYVYSSEAQEVAHSDL